MENSRTNNNLGAFPGSARPEATGAFSTIAPHSGLARETRGVPPPPWPRAAPAESALLRRFAALCAAGVPAPQRDARWLPAGQLLPSPGRPRRAALTLPGKGPGSRSFSACLFSSTRRALQFSHQTPPRSDPGEEPPPLPEPGEPVPKPGEPPREPGELVPMPGEAGPGEPVKELGDEVPEPGDGVPDEPRAEPAPSGVGRLPARDSSYAFRYQLSGEKGAAGLVGEQTSFTCGKRHAGVRGTPEPGRAGSALPPAWESGRHQRAQPSTDSGRSGPLRALRPNLPSSVSLIVLK